MANKKFFWIKLRPDFFNDPYIKLLRRMAGGDKYTIIYLEMLVKSAATDGMIYFQGAGADIAEELSLMLNENVEDVRALLAYLEAKKLITHPEIKQDLFLVASADLTGSETNSAQRVRQFRERQQEKALQSNTQVTNSNDKLEKELEIEKEIELDTELETNNEKMPAYEMLDYFNQKMNRDIKNKGTFSNLVFKNISVQEFKDVINYVCSWREDVLQKTTSATINKKFEIYSDQAAELGYRDGKEPKKVGKNDKLAPKFLSNDKQTTTNLTNDDDNDDLPDWMRDL